MSVVIIGGLGFVAVAMLMYVVSWFAVGKGWRGEEESEWAVIGNVVFWIGMALVLGGLAVTIVAP